jgi:mannose-6-phosphate isomerase-like protein (cupin superfamily)
MASDPSDNVGTRLLFENERVRVWDLALAPGETLQRHIHRLDYLFIVVNGGALVHANPNDPADRHAVTYNDDQVVFIEANGGVVHQPLTNIGSTPYRNLVVELKQP